MRSKAITAIQDFGGFKFMEGNRKECVWSKPQSIKYILLYIGNKVVYKAQKPVLEGFLLKNKSHNRNL
jgi:hypothetical protein